MLIFKNLFFFSEALKSLQGELSKAKQEIEKLQTLKTYYEGKVHTSDHYIHRLQITYDMQPYTEYLSLCQE